MNNITIANKILSLLFILLLQLILFNGNAEAQGWIKYYPHKDTSNQHSTTNFSNAVITSTHDGGFLYSRQQLIGNTNNAKVNLVKVDQDGSIQWDKEYDHPNPDVRYPSIYEILQLADGSYVVCGEYSMSTINTSSRNLFLLKVEEFGDVIWDRLYNTVSLPYMKSHFVETSDKGFLIATSDQISTSSKGAVIKVDSLGNEVWRHPILSMKDIVKIVPGPSNTYHVITQIAGQLPQPIAGQIYQFDTQGYIQTNNITPPYTDDVWITDAVVDSDGGLVFTGMVGGDLLIYKRSSLGNNID